jgi:hypothetical protein
VDIHKPKPVHSWRGLAAEIGIIVVSVLIALGAEQGVEAVHWANEVRAERAALHEEIAANLAAALTRQEEEACVHNRLADLAQVFARHKAGAPLGLLGPVGRPVEVGVAHGTWEIALAGQALAHMPLQEKLDLSSAFDGFQNMENQQLQENAAWIRLTKLDTPDLLEAADWADLRDAYAHARAIDDRMAFLPAYIVKNTSAGVAPKGPKLKDSLLSPTDLAICKPLIAR